MCVCVCLFVCVCVCLFVFVGGSPSRVKQPSGHSLLSELLVAHANLAGLLGPRANREKKSEHGSGRGKKKSEILGGPAEGDLGQGSWAGSLAEGGSGGGGKVRRRKRKQIRKI